MVCIEDCTPAPQDVIYNTDLNISINVLRQ